MGDLLIFSYISELSWQLLYTEWAWAFEVGTVPPKDQCLIACRISFPRASVSFQNIHITTTNKLFKCTWCNVLFRGFEIHADELTFVANEPDWSTQFPTPLNANAFLGGFWTGDVRSWWCGIDHPIDSNGVNHPIDSNGVIEYTRKWEKRSAICFRGWAVKNPS